MIQPKLAPVAWCGRMEDKQQAKVWKNGDLRYQWVDSLKNL